jgi:hypothetical protein
VTALDCSSTLVDRFNAARSVLDCVLPRSRRVGRTYQGFIKALLRISATFLPRLQHHLRTCITAIAGQHWKRFGWVIFAVDGSKIDCVRSRANEQTFAIGAKHNSHPQQLLTTLWHMGTGLPWAWVAGRADDSEREHLRELLSVVPKGALLVADAGFTGFDLLWQLQRAGMFFLIRVGCNVTLLQELGRAQRKSHDTVYLWPTDRRSLAPLVLRLIKVRPQGKRKPIFLISNVLDQDRLSHETAAAIYRLRWGVEMFYRSLKQTLQRRKMRSAAPRQAALELHWTLIGLLLMGLLSVRGIIARGKDPLCWSVACALRAVRQAICSTLGSARTLMARLATAL